MSYHQISIDQLSHPQTLKLLRGQPTTVRHGNGHTITVSEAQAKNIMKKGITGSGVRLVMDPYASNLNRHIHGQGFFSSLKKGASAAMSNPMVKSLAKQGANAAINYAVQSAAPMAAQYGLDGVVGNLGAMAAQHVDGMGIRRRVRGKGMFSKIGNMAKSALKNPAIRSLVTNAGNAALASQGLPPVAGMALNMTGLGVKKRRGRPRGGALMGP